jgi:hypothetical protein
VNALIVATVACLERLAVSERHKAARAMVIDQGEGM